MSSEGSDRVITRTDFDENGYLISPVKSEPYEQIEGDSQVSLENVEIAKNVMEELEGCQYRSRNKLEKTASEYLEDHSEETASEEVDTLEEAGLITELNGNIYSTIHGVKLYNHLFDEELNTGEPVGHLTG